MFAIFFYNSYNPLHQNTEYLNIIINFYLFLCVVLGLRSNQLLLFAHVFYLRDKAQKSSTFLTTAKNGILVVLYITE